MSPKEQRLEQKRLRKERAIADTEAQGLSKEVAMAQRKLFRQQQNNRARKTNQALRLVDAEKFKMEAVSD